ncbi:FtsX-like permease family protein, partial [uncultured Oscillibacter sp.]|uniref:ABC transporter permease n=1 Tax=uncultured Oscillibacter sp. TaxID=876091 RepID=UPI00344BC510
ADTLFPYTDPIGKTVAIGGYPFLVVGTYYQKDGGAEDSMDHMAAVPYTVNRALLRSDRVDSITVKVNSTKNVDTVMFRLELWLAEQIDGAVGEYSLADGNSAMAESNDEMTSLSVVLGGIASIALLVGGIGIMNIMLVTVTERTREIGIKKSIGAPRWEIIGQFLLEAGILSS